VSSTRWRNSWHVLAELVAFPPPPGAVDSAGAATHKQTSGSWFDRPSQARLLPNVRRSADRQERSAEEQPASDSNLLVQGLRATLFLLGWTERCEVSAKGDRASALPLQSRSLPGTNCATNWSGISSRGPSPDHFGVDSRLPTYYDVPSTSFGSNSRIWSEHVEGTHPGASAELSI
jgi:hypothetical protein